MQPISQDGVIIHDKDAVGPAGDGLPAGHCVDRFERTTIGTPFGQFVFFSTQAVFVEIGRDTRLAKIVTDTKSYADSESGPSGQYFQSEGIY